MAILAKFGLLLTGVGAAHFVVPEFFESVTKLAFPVDTAEWVKRNGGAEVGLGLAMVLPPTRKLALLGLAGYTGWLGYNAANVASAGACSAGAGSAG